MLRFISWVTAERELLAQNCRPANSNAYGQWWEAPRGTSSFFVQWINAERDVDAAAFRQQMQELQDERHVRDVH